MIAESVVNRVVHRFLRSDLKSFVLRQTLRISDVGWSLGRFLRQSRGLKARTRLFMAGVESLEVRILPTESSTVLIPVELGFSDADQSLADDSYLSIMPLITDGQQAPYRPEVVSISVPLPGGGALVGSGTFISRMDVLTAAHVVDTNQDSHYDPVTDGIPTIFASQNADFRIGTKSYRVASVTVAPGYLQINVGGHLQTLVNDLAILHLESYEEIAIPATINRSPPVRDQLIEILGYGQIGSVDSGVVQNNNYVRNRGIAQIDTVQPKTMSWALDQKGESATRPGDSGGPSFVWDSNGNRFLAGVTSFGDTEFGIGARSTVTRVDAYQSWIDQTIRTLNASAIPSAQVIFQNDITEAQPPTPALRVTFRSANPIHLVPGNPAVALIGPNGYYNSTLRNGLTTTSADGTLITIDYYFDGPAGTWKSSDNGSYTAVLLEGGIVSALGISLRAGPITTFNVNVPVDSSPPTATSVNRTITSPGSPNLVVQVTYSDPSGIDGSSLGNDDVQLINSNGAVVSTGRLMIQGPIRNATTYVAMYEFLAPGGSWDASDNGTYRLVTQPGRVWDVSRNVIAGGILSTLTVSISLAAQIAPWAVVNAPNVTSSAAATAYTFTVTYFDDKGINLASVQEDHGSQFGDVMVFSSNLGVEPNAHLLSVSRTTDGSPVIATYQWVSPYPWSGFNSGVRFDVAVSGVTDTDGNQLQGGYIGVFQLNISGISQDRTAPQVFVSAPPLTGRGLQTYTFDALFTDDVALNLSSITSGSLIVVAPSGEELAARTTSINYGNSGPMTAVTFGIDAPGGTWDSADDGLYRIVVRDGSIADTSGNFIPGFQSGGIPDNAVLVGFDVQIRTEIPPAIVDASLNVQNISSQRDSHEFTVHFTCADDVDTSSLGDNDVYATGPNGFAQFATFVSFALDPDTKAIIAKYRIGGPGGNWGPDDNGIYTLSISSGSVKGVTKNSVAAMDLGTFTSTVLENHAPVLDNSFSPLLLSEPEVSNRGTLISTLIAGSITDIDAHALQGMAVKLITTNLVTFQFSLDDGLTWIDLGSVSSNSARLLAADDSTRIRFISHVNQDLLIPEALIFCAWDQTSGTNGATVDASWTGSSTAFSTTLNMASLSITSINQAPVFTSDSTVNLTENQTRVTTITATDLALPAQMLTYEITGGADAAKFTLGRDGMLAFLTAPDFERPGDADGNNIYSLIVTASDGVGGKTEQQLSVAVTASNDNNPVFTSLSALSIPENSTAVLTVIATDADLPVQTMTYSLTGGQDQSRFVITAGGVLSFLMAPDYEIPADSNADNAYFVQVTANDGAGGTTTQNLSVTVTGINDNNPVFISSATFSITEDMTDVGTITATDADLPAHSAIFSINGGADAARFSITTGGKLSFIAPPDYEIPADADANNIYHLEVLASDGAGRTALQYVAVTVTNSNEAPVIGLSQPAVRYRLKQQPAPAIDAAATFIARSPGASLAGANLIISLGVTRDRKDVLGLLNGSATDIHQRGKKLLFGTTVIGAVTGGKNKLPDLTITFNEATTNEIVQSTIRKITFAAKHIGTGPRTVTMRLTIIGGLDSNTATRELMVQ